MLGGVRVSGETGLKSVRDRIDQLDAHIQALISERGTLAMEVAHIKRAAGDTVFYRPEREAEVLRGVIARNQGVLPDKEMARLFREIMSACLALEEPLKVAFLGPEGTYTHAAALKHFGHSVMALPNGAIDEVFREVEAGAAKYGVVPIENSTEGMVSHTLDMFTRSSLRICGEVELRIHHHLLSQKSNGVPIHRIYSHAQSLAQCREWLDSHMANIERVSCSSNADAARRAASEVGTAAIASAAAGEIYQLVSLAANIEDEPNNTTRFLVIGNQSTQSTGNDKTSLLLSTKNRPGALCELLTALGRNDISMTRIESRPSRRGTWDYVFYIDIEGHAEDERVKPALAEIANEADMFTLLGSYPRAPI